MKRRILLLAVVIVALAAAFAFAPQNKAPDLPPGISPTMWVALTDNSGIALRDLRPLPSLHGKPVVHGTLMVKVGNTWQTMCLDSMPELIPVLH